jgi:FimV-like protein
MPQRISAVVDGQQNALGAIDAVAPQQQGVVSAPASPSGDAFNRVEALLAHQRQQQSELTQSMQEARSQQPSAEQAWPSMGSLGLQGPSATTVGLVCAALVGAALLVWIFPRLQVLWESLRFGRNTGDHSQPPSGYESQWDQMDVLVDRYTNAQHTSGVDLDALRADAAALPEIQPMPSYSVNPATKLDVDVDLAKGHSVWDDMPVVVARDTAAPASRPVPLSASAALVPQLPPEPVAASVTMPAALEAPVPPPVLKARKSQAIKRAVRPLQGSVLRPQMSLREIEDEDEDKDENMVPASEPITSPMPLDFSASAQAELDPALHSASNTPQTSHADFVHFELLVDTAKIDQPVRAAPTLSTPSGFGDSSLQPLDAYDTQLELAQEFVGLGQYDEAIALYQEVIAHANASEAAIARRLLSQVPHKH